MPKLSPIQLTILQAIAARPESAAEDWRYLHRSCGRACTRSLQGLTERGLITRAGELRIHSNGESTRWYGYLLTPLGQHVASKL